MSNNSSPASPEKPLILPEVLESDVAFTESLITIRRDRLKLPDHEKPYNYYSLITKAYSVVILALTSDGKYLLNEEYRHPTGKTILSCPGGFIDGHEQAEEAAKRELLEETGMQAESITCMGSAYPYPGISGQKTFFMLAAGVKTVARPKLEASEILRTIKITESELQKAIAAGAEIDASLCTALFFYKQR